MIPKDNNNGDTCGSGSDWWLIQVTWYQEGSRTRSESPITNTKDTGCVNNEKHWERLGNIGQVLILGRFESCASILSLLAHQVLHVRAQESILRSKGLIRVLVLRLSHMAHEASKGSWQLDKLINIVTSDPVLCQRDMTKPFELEVDASAFATGAILLQWDHRNKP